LNSSEVHQDVFNCGYTFILQPLYVSKVLIQIGYEPDEPIWRGRSLVCWRKGFYYPNGFKYMRNIAKREGSRMILFTGVVPRLGQGIVSNYVRNEILASLPPSTSKCPPERVGYEMYRQCVAAGAAVVASHPLLVVCNRMIASIIGGEAKYGTMTMSIKTIYNEDGLLGFFSGLAPHLISELLARVLEILLAEVIQSAGVQEKMGQQYGEFTHYMPCSIMYSFITYPFQLVTTMMTINQCGVTACSLPTMQGHNSWLHCFTNLWQRNLITRGNNIWLRKAVEAPLVATEAVPVAATVDEVALSATIEEIEYSARTSSPPSLPAHEKEE